MAEVVKLLLCLNICLMLACFEILVVNIKSIS